MYYMDTQTAKEHLGRLVAAAQYIEQATRHQNISNQRLTTALKVATQMTEQLARGATSATDAAAQLELVVKQLRYVVGK
jgi:methyl-accepting chemotaxis protein